jgi:hypothetical protein
MVVVGEALKRGKQLQLRMFERKIKGKQGTEDVHL